jgi:FKBP-type peptidyl-prolyl cis-trans isomerase
MPKHHLQLQRRIGLVTAALICFPVLVQAQPATELPTPGLQTPQAQASYGIGRQIGSDLARGGLEGDLLDIAALLSGIQDALGNKESQISQEQWQAAMGQIQQLAQDRMQQKMQAAAEKNRQLGPKFLQKYKASEGVKQTPSGLLYKVIKQGTGPSPQKTDVVRTHYLGRFVDGKEFDSTYKRNQPAEFPLDQVIPGWTEALQMMKVGDRWQLVLPPNLAYGEQGNPPAIGPDAVLVFDIELLAILPPGEPVPQK